GAGDYRRERMFASPSPEKETGGEEKRKGQTQMHTRAHTHTHTYTHTHSLFPCPSSLLWLYNFLSSPHRGVLRQTVVTLSSRCCHDLFLPDIPGLLLLSESASGMSGFP